LGKSIGLNQTDITSIIASKRRERLFKLNPIYWISQVLIFLISLFYSVNIGIQKRNATYPFESETIAIFLAPVPLSVHIFNAIYSITGEKRSGLNKRLRFLVFFINFSIFAFLFYIYYVSLPKIYQSGVMYNVFNARDTWILSVNSLNQKHQ